MNFDRVARHYWRLERLSFGEALDRRRRAFLDCLPCPSRTLIIGEGDGRFLARFIKRFPGAKVDVVEKSGAMIRIAETRLKSAGQQTANIRFHQLDALRDPWPSANYDLVVTHYVLDCMSRHQVHALIKRVCEAGASEFRWLVSEFQLPSSAAWRRLAECALAVIYAFFGVTAGLSVRTVPDYRPGLLAAGLLLQNNAETWRGFLCSELWVRPNQSIINE